jgi:Putative addiction module component
MTTKAILDAALKLPAKTRARLAGKLLDSLDEPVWEEAIIAGAKVAEQGLRGLRTGKTKGIPEDEAHRLLFGRKKA